MLVFSWFKLVLSWSCAGLKLVGPAHNQLKPAKDQHKPSKGWSKYHFLSFEASVVINTEYSKLWREEMNIFFSLIKAGISVHLSVCLHFYYVENRSSNDFTRGGCVAADPRECSVTFWCNMDTRHVQN